MRTSPDHDSPLPARGLYVITPDTLDAVEVVSVQVAKAIRGGAVMVQYRDKLHRGTELTTRIEKARRVCKLAGIPFILNDDPLLAKLSDADGVHIGERDTSAEEARRVLGKTKIIGVSCYNSLALANKAQSMGANYVAFGSFFPSRTKPQARRASIALLQEAKLRLSIPIVAIGGIKPRNAMALIRAGADIVAVVDGVFGQADPERAARSYSRLFQAQNHAEEL
ncbi:MAG: thiamine phosphate synthase [Gammaproteobacteria bacterium]